MALQHLKGRVQICNRVWCLHPNKGRGEGKSISRGECEERQSLFHMRSIPSIYLCFGSSVGDQTRQFLREERESQCPVKDNAAEEFNGALRLITGRSGEGGGVYLRVLTRRNCRLLAALTKISWSVIWPSLPLCTPLSELFLLAEDSRLLDKVVLPLNLTPEGLFDASNREKAIIKSLL